MFEKNALAYRIKCKFDICELYAPHIALKILSSCFLVILPACVAILPSSAKRDFACYSLDKVQPALRAVSLFRSVCFHYTHIAANVNSSVIKILHKKVRLILCKLTKQIFLYYIVYNSWTTILLLLYQYVYIDIDYCIFLSIDCINIYSYILY